jgi:cytochrome c peroxidase
MNMKRFLQVCSAACLMALVVPATAQERARDRYPQRNEEKSAQGASGISATFRVEAGQSVQAAVDRARPGDTVEVMPGIYNEAVTIDFDDIKLIGVIENGERPIFDGKMQMNDAILCSGNNFVIENIEMRNYKGNGVVVNQAKNATFRNLVADNTGKYGVYPVLCDGVLVENCFVSNVWDAGIYAGQCKNVVLQNNEAFRNTIGLETENCVNVLITNNSAHDNSLGILVVLLPDLPTTVASNAKVINNRVFNNNFPNKAPEGELVAMVQPGVGIAVNAADNTEVTKNILQGNGSFGVAMYSLLDTFPPEHKLNVEPNPDGNFIHHNVYAENGTGQLGTRFTKFGVTKGADLFWSGKGVGNGWDEAGATSYPENLPKWTGGVAGGGK